jgi:hypothetical protein
MFSKVHKNWISFWNDICKNKDCEVLVDHDWWEYVIRELKEDANKKMKERNITLRMG